MSLMDTQGLLNKVFDSTNGALRIVTAADRILLDANAFAGTPVGGAGLNSPNTDTELPRWAFDAAAVERIKFTWTPPATWAAFTVAAMQLGETPFNTGNVVWRYKHLPIVLATNPNSALTLVNTVTAAGLAVNTASHFMLVPTPVTITLGAFGEIPEYLTVVDRFATDAADVCTNDQSLAVITMLRA